MPNTPEQQASTKRRAQDVEEPDAKRMRFEASGDAAVGEGKTAEANLARLPVELQLKILRDLVVMNLDDPQTALRGVAAFRRTSLSLHQVTETEFSTENVEGKRIGGNRRITSHIKRLGEGIEGLDEIPRRISAENRRDFNIKNTAMNADFIALQTTDKRPDTVRDVLSLENGPIKYDSVQSLIFNIDYIHPRIRSGIVSYVCDLQREDGGAEHLVKKLIERTEHLTPADRAVLAETSYGIQDADKRRGCLNVWAGRTHLLTNHQDEPNVLSRICEDSVGKGYSLGSFTMHMSKVSSDNRPLLIRNVIELPPDHPGRMWAMSQLAANFNHLSKGAGSTIDSFRREVVSDILAKVSQHPSEPISEDLSKWQTEPSLCLVEAVHHLSSHKDLLDEDEIDRVESHIKEILQEDSVEAYPRQAQLISHMSNEQRRDFVGNALKTEEPAGMAAIDMPAKPIREGVILALTLRVKDLLAEEKQIYVDHVCSAETWGEFVEEALRYNFNEHLKDFKGEQRTDLVNERLDFFVRNECDKAAEILSDIAQNAKFLKAGDISNVIKTAKIASSRAYRHSDDNDSTINSFAGISARVLANWSRNVLSTSLNPRRLDGRSSKRSAVR